MIDVDQISELARAAIEKAGGGAVLARKVGVTRYAVQQWKHQGVPSSRVGKVSEITGIPFHGIRPDLFKPAPIEVAQSA